MRWAYGQYSKTYLPRKTYSDQSRKLISEVRHQLNEELKRLEKDRPLVSRIYAERSNYLIRQIKNEAFIEDDSLQRFVDVVFGNIVAVNKLTHTPKRVLILKSPEVNAFCYGEGTFIITIGLLAKIENESQLAFAIAHELAHYELDHIHDRVVQEVELRLSKKTKEELTKLFAGTITIEEIEELRKLIYGLSAFSREKEIDADSLGFILFKNTAYAQSEALSLLTVLDSAQAPKFPLNANLFSPFYFSKYPFQQHWLKKRLNIFSRKDESTLIFSNDSINTHPDIFVRKAKIQSLLAKKDNPRNQRPDEFVRATIELASFEAVESAYDRKEYDRCMFLALELLARYPHNDYLITTVGRLLIDLIQFRNLNTFHFYVPRYTGTYSDALRTVNNFLYNLETNEMSEVAYHFLNNQSNFKEDVPAHYFLLWKVCGLTYRDEVQERIKQAYRTKFNKNIQYFDLGD
ncbi:MAG: M48 family metallopeptidase [Bacteroidota bacterium]